MVQDYKNILLIDDHFLTREMVSSILQAEGFEVDTAENGIEGVEKIKNKNDFSLVVTDLEMPEMGGSDFIIEIKKMNIKTPVIVLSGNNDVEKAIKALEIGAYEYVLKDENINNSILLAVKRVLEKEELTRKNIELIKRIEINNKELAQKNTSMIKAIQSFSESTSSILSEKDLGKLLELIVRKSRELTSADGGTLYLFENDNKLHFKVVQNGSMNTYLGGPSQEKVNFPPVELDKSKVSAFSAMEKKIINIADVYENQEFDFSGPKNFDKATGYKTKSMLVLPMVNRDNIVIGVLQLINSKQSDEKGSVNIVPFSKYQEELCNAFACQAAICLENVINLEKIKLKNIAFMKFVPTEFIHNLGKKEVEEISLGDVSHTTLSVLFSDIRSFTFLSESMSPEECFRFLNSYLTHIGPVIAEYRGFIDKYIGDAIMALFAGENSSHADDSVLAAIGMQTRVREYNGLRAQSGYKPISIGVGINSGPLTLGTIGFEKRMDSTVIGDTVNLSSRMEGLTSMYSIGITISSATYDLLRDKPRFMVREIDTVKVKGKEQAVVVYEVFNSDIEALREQKLSSLPKFNEGINLYKTGKMSDALLLFNEMWAGSPEDTIARLYSQRCKKLVENPVDNWNYVTRLYEK